LLVALRKPNSRLKLLPKRLLPLLRKLLLLWKLLLLRKLLLPSRPLLLKRLLLPKLLLPKRQSKLLNKDTIKKETEATLSLFFMPCRN